MKSISLRPQSTSSGKLLAGTWFTFSLVSLLSAMVLLSSPVQAQNPLTNGLVAYWNFNTDNFIDSIGIFDGVEVGSNPITFVDGRPGFGKAMELDGVDQYVQIIGREGSDYDPDQLAFAGGNVSISGWFKVTAFDKSWQALVAKGEGNSWRVARNGANPTMSYAGGLPDVTGSTPVTDDKWHHFVAMSDSTGSAFGSALYIDGNLEGTASGPAGLIANTLNVQIGGNPGAGGRTWNGDIDDLAIWSRLLTPAEIGLLWGGGTNDPLNLLLNPPPGTVTITQQPTNTTVLEGFSAQFSVQTTFTGKIPPSYQWQSNNVDIAGAVGSTYTTPAMLRADSGTQYKVIATVPGASVVSAPATLTVTPDTLPPSILSSEGLATLDGITIHFNKPLDDVSAAELTHYEVDGGITVLSVAVRNERDVVLTTSAQTPGTKYTVTVNNVKDRFGNTIAANSKTSFTPATLATGLMAYWKFDSDFSDSVNAFSGTARGTNPVTFVDGKFGKAVHLDGTGQFVEVTGGASADNLAFAGGSISIAGWFKVGAFDKDWQALIAKGEGTNWRVARSGSSQTLAYAGGVGDITSPTFVADESWHHFAAITDSAGVAFGTALYIDGVLDTQNPNPAILAKNSRNVFIGENPDAMGRSWNGDFDDLAIWNRVLTEGEILSLVDGGAGKTVASLVPPIVKLTDGLVAYWNFDGNLLDAVTNFNGTARGTVPVAFPDSKAGFGKALSLNGTNFVEITGGGSSTNLQFASNSVSISGWFKVGAFDKSWQALISKGEGSNYRIARRADTQTLAYAGGTGEGADDIPALNDGQWHHFVAITDANTNAFGTALYMDGILHGVNTNKPVLAAGTSNLFIGENPGALNRQWNGQIDDVAIWNRALSGAEVIKVYNAGVTGMPLSTVSGVNPPTILSLVLAGNSLTIQWSGSGGTLETSPTVDPGAVWSTVGTANPATIPIGTGNAFYRVRK